MNRGWLGVAVYIFIKQKYYNRCLISSCEELLNRNATKYDT